MTIEAAEAGATSTPASVRPSDIVRLSGWLARWHADARDGAVRSSWPLALAEDVDDLLASLGSVLLRVCGPSRAVAFEDEMRAFVTRNRLRLLRRAAEGAVRGPHVHLRLDRIVRRGDDGFDVVEGDPHDRHRGMTDEAVDVASIALDLEMSGHDELAELFVGTLNEGWEVLPLLAFYRRYVALHRARCIAERDMVEAERLVRLAIRPPPASSRPRLVIVAGNDADARVELARSLSRALCAATVSVDVNNEPRESGVRLVLDSDATARAYTTAIGRADVVLGARRSVIVEGRFRDAGVRRAVETLARAHDAEVRFVDCSAPRGCRAYR